MTEIRARKGYDLGGGSRVGLKGARARIGKSTDIEDRGRSSVNCISGVENSRFKPLATVQSRTGTEFTFAQYIHFTYTFYYNNKELDIKKRDTEVPH